MDGRSKSGHDERSNCVRVLSLFRSLTHSQPMKGGWVYILTNRPNGTLYVGVTADLARRVQQHRDGAVEGFTRRYGLKRLVYAERHEEITEAIRREKALKHWSRAKKVWLILERNPEWLDICDQLPI